ncbi:hypothetical protein K435DRAFT_572366, partial [Dendrothele bispora CBS 962.96]
AKEERARQEEKKKKEAQKAKDKKEKETANVIRRLTQTQTASAFSGSLKNKNKTACGDIANALGITVTGVLAEMRLQIAQHFEANPALKTNARYAGLFRTRGQKRAA